MVVGLLVILASSGLLPAGETEQIDINEYLIEVEVDADSGPSRQEYPENRLRELEDPFLVEIVRAPHLIRGGATGIHQAGDKLIFSGDIKRVNALRRSTRPAPVRGRGGAADQHDGSHRHARSDDGQDGQGQPGFASCLTPRWSACVRSGKRLSGQAWQYHHSGR